MTAAIECIPFGIDRLPWVMDDGGRELAGFKGRTGDCTIRACAIGTGENYRDVYDEFMAAQRAEYLRRTAAGKKATKPRPSNGIDCSRIVKPWLAERGWLWVPTMKIGTGTTHHLRVGEVPASGTIIVRLSRHVAAVVDGVIHDTHDPSRDGTRAVYGWWEAP